MKTGANGYSTELAGTGLTIEYSTVVVTGYSTEMQETKFFDLKQFGFCQKKKCVQGKIENKMWKKRP